LIGNQDSELATFSIRFSDYPANADYLPATLLKLSESSLPCKKRDTLSAPLFPGFESTFFNFQIEITLSFY